MNEMILAVLAVLLTSQGNLPSRSVPFDRMPAILASAYDADIRQWRNAKEAEVAEIDFDGDGCAEKLVFNGQAGSGGEGWTIFQKNPAGWRKIGDVPHDDYALDVKFRDGTCKKYDYRQGIFHPQSRRGYYAPLKNIKNFKKVVFDIAPQWDGGIHFDGDGELYRHNGIPIKDWTDTTKLLKNRIKGA